MRPAPALHGAIEFDDVSFAYRPEQPVLHHVSFKIEPGESVAVLGYTGAGVKVAVADTGLDYGDAATMHPDLFGRTPVFFHYGTNLTDAADEHGDGVQT